jgi:fermentation-respiration switch protein FrsA (DUF1100 family)
MTALVMLALLAAAPASLWLLQRRLIYFPVGHVPPAEAVLPGWDEVTLNTEDGLILDAWYHPPASTAAVVIVFNGNAGNRADRAPLGAALARSGFGVLLVDYRGYGSNEGHPTAGGLALDARAARRHVDDNAPGHPICYFGESLGAAVAVELASELPPAGLVLRSPFTSLADVAREHYPFLPVQLMLRDRYPSIELIASIDAPLLVIAGSADSIVPVEQSEAIYRAAAHPGRLLVIDGADHNDFELLAGADLMEATTEFLAQLP